MEAPQRVSRSSATTKEQGMNVAGLNGLRSTRTTATILRLACAALTIFSPLAASAAPAVPLLTLHAVHSLSKIEAGAALPAAFEATVTYYDPSDVDLFVQDGDEALYIQTQPGEPLVPGDRVLIQGKTRDSFTPDVISDKVTVIRHGTLPAPIEADYRQLIRAKLDCVWVSVKGKVRSADTVNFGNMHGIFLKLMMEGGMVDATIVTRDTARLDQLLDSEVEVNGVVSGKFDSKMQLIGILIEVPSMANVKVLKPAPVSLDALPLTPMNEILSSYDVRDYSGRVRVRGSITYYQPGSAIVLQNGTTSLWIGTHSSAPMRVGDVAEATGFPETRDGFLTLTEGEIRDTNIHEPIAPQQATWRQLSTWNTGDPDGHQSDLVSFEGDVVTSVRDDSQDEIVMRSSDNKLFSAIYRHPPGDRPLPTMPKLEPGMHIRVTGICMALQPNTVDPVEQEVPFNILMRSYDDVDVLAMPPVVNVRNLVILACLLLALLIVAGLRSLMRERKVRFQNAAVAHLERQRSRILEDINGSRPLAEILEQITQLVSFKLRGAGAHCWCQIKDGAQLGDHPGELASYRIVEEQISSRSGEPHGTIYAAFDPLSKPRTDESETLFMAAALATVAIETRRLYSDLVYRSEYDLLTHIHNRFSMESRLEKQIEAARQNAGIFGLVYIDLNDFKRINDVYGHHIGDLYLQEVAKRMKNQLRGDDMLARLGGDEFAVLLPNIRTRAEVEEVALRIERGLDGEFSAEGYTVEGSASVGIALYPEDGTTVDSVFSAADAAMYVNKHVRKPGV
jgi:diguanylate cyclase (GGDEF)-like protein